MEEFKQYELIDFHRLLTLKYKKIGLNELELVIIQLIMVLDYKKLISPKTLANYMSIEEKEIDSLLMNLMNKGIIRFYSNHFDLDNLYDLLLEKKVVENIDHLDNLVKIFSKELGKLLSPIEIDTIRKWRELGLEDDLIIEALKEAILANAFYIRYIDRIIRNWRQRNILTVSDLERTRV